MNDQYPKNNLTREGIITNMCYTWDHAFGLDKDPNAENVINRMAGYTDEERKILWNNMAQIYDNDIAPFHTLNGDNPSDIED